MPEDGDRGWLIVGRAGKPHGVQGDLLVEIITDFPERLTDGVRFGLGDDSGPSEFFLVHRVRYHKGRWLLSVKDIRDRDDIGEWRGRFLYLPEQALENLPEGYYYEHHLTGLECRSPGGEMLGQVTGFDPLMRARLMELKIKLQALNVLVSRAQAQVNLLYITGDG